MSTDNRYGNNTYPHSAGTGRTRYGNHKADTVVAPGKKAAVDGHAAADVAELATQAATVVDATSFVAPIGVEVGVAATPSRLAAGIASGFTRTAPRTRDAGSGEPAAQVGDAAVPVDALEEIPIGWGVATGHALTMPTRRR